MANKLIAQANSCSQACGNERDIKKRTDHENL